MSRTPSATSDDSVLKRARTVATALDESVRVPGVGVRIGIDPILGLLPVSGDIASGVLSLYIVGEAVRAGAPRSTVLKMLRNVGIDVLGGSIPLLGTVFDAFWKANVRNVELLADFLDVDEDADTVESDVQLN